MNEGMTREWIKLFPGTSRPPNESISIERTFFMSHSLSLSLILSFSCSLSERFPIHLYFPNYLFVLIVSVAVLYFIAVGVWFMNYILSSLSLHKALQIMAIHFRWLYWAIVETQFLLLCSGICNWRCSYEQYVECGVLNTHTRAMNRVGDVCIAMPT